MDFDAFLNSLIAVGRGQVSDIHFKVGSPPLLRISGELLPAKFSELDPDMTRTIAQNLLSPKLTSEMESLKDYDGSYQIPEGARLRVNIFQQRGNYTIVLRVIPTQVPKLDELNLPRVVKEIALENRGLVLVTGITGSGKSTTLAAMIGHVNANRRAHILTIEDPIEFIHEDRMSSINQREVGRDSDSFGAALRAGLRQDPDIILVGEMRDVETMGTAIKAAETGHLVFSTLHTTDAPSTVSRIIDMFPPEQQRQLRAQIATNLKATISQRLVVGADGQTRLPAAEIMRSTSTIREYIENPEKTGQLRDAIEQGRSQYGMQSFDQHLTELFRKNRITLETALEAATSPSDLQRNLSFE